LVLSAALQLLRNSLSRKSEITKTWVRPAYVRVLGLQDVSASEVVVCLEVHPEGVEEVEHRLERVIEVAVAAEAAVTSWE
jgi:hypothetical protein